ncbi:MAG: phosphate/phosphite/phosphonate ABC transporter substrate-binding protein [Sphaerochaetaceae bacterium]|nr:phosphate/phosphite/phosphonate ABC transporter substrate-binding protein [Sphaerochaetaceae bacterium]
MKKTIAILLVVACAFAVFAQGATESKPATDSKVIDSLTLVYAPTYEVSTLTKMMEPLKESLPRALANYGYTLEKFDVTVATSMEIIAEGLAAGTIDFGVVGATTYVLYEDEVVPLAQVSRLGYEHDTRNIADWNTGNVTKSDTVMCPGSRSVLWVNILTEKGQELLAKAENNNLTWDDLVNAKWSLGKTTSATSFILPSLWLDEMYGTGVGQSKKSVEMLKNASVGNGGSAIIEALLLGQVDIACNYQDKVYGEQATYDAFAKLYPELAAQGKKPQDILKAIALTERSVNEVWLAGTGPKMTPEFCDALAKALMDLANSADPADNQPFRDVNQDGLIVPLPEYFEGARQQVAAASK